MISLLPNYLPMEILVGVAIGLLGGLLAVFMIPPPIHRHPATFGDMVAFFLLAIIVLLPVLFPMSLFLALALIFLTVWIVLPIIFGGGKRTIRSSSRQRSRVPIPAQETPAKIQEIRDAVEMLSPEGRAAMLDDMRIFQ